MLSNILKLFKARYVSLEIVIRLFLLYSCLFDDQYSILLKKKKTTFISNCLVDRIDSVTLLFCIIIKTYPIAQIVDEYLERIYGYIRFGGDRINLPTALTPTDTIELAEMPYISVSLEEYSDELKVKIDTTKSLEAYNFCFKYLNRQRKERFKPVCFYASGLCRETGKKKDSYHNGKQGEKVGRIFGIK